MYYDKLRDLGIEITRRSGSEKVKCPKCYDGRKNKNRKDLNVNITTGEYCCHNTPCEFRGNVRAQERPEVKKEYVKPDQNMLKSAALNDKVYQYMAKRGISEPTLQRYMIYSKNEWMPQTQKEEPCICFPYFKDGSLVNVKFRDNKKNFKMIKEAELSLFGLQFLRNRKKMIIVEGEIDCLATAEVGFGADIPIREVVDNETGEVQEMDISQVIAQYCPVSVPNGAAIPKEGQRLQLEYLDNCFEHLIAIEEFVIAVDGDKAGDILKEELIRRLGAERCKFITYPDIEIVPLENNLFRRCKDLNEVLLYLGEEAVISCIMQAQFPKIEGVHYLADIKGRMIERFKKGIMLGGSPRLGPEFDRLFRWKIGDLNLGVGYGNHGKTTFQNQIELARAIYDDDRFAVFCPENYPADDFYDDLVEPLVGMPLRDMKEEDYVMALAFIEDHFYYVYPEDEHDLFNIHERFRNLILKKGVTGVRIDPWNQLDKLRSTYGMTGEEALSAQLKMSKRFALTNGVYYSILAHPKNPTYAADKSLPVVDMYDIAGGAQWGNKVDNIWSYHRPNWHISKEMPQVDVYMQKIKRKRTGGELGQIQFVLDPYTKRFISPDNIAYLDPKRAEKVKRIENFDQGIQGNVYGDDPDYDLPF